jgi:hypothetical protein
MTAADLDGTTVDGTNADLNGPIGHSIRDLGYAVADATSVADADVAQVTDAQTDEYLDVATYYTLAAVLGNLDDVDIRVGPRSEKLNQLAEQVERLMDRMRERLEDAYGHGFSVVATGYIQLDRAEHD